MLDVSCIIINYNTSAYTVACVESILESEVEANFEVIIVDNASQDEDYSSLKKVLKDLDDDKVRLIKSRQNVGFGGGNMLGVQASSPCQFFAFINNDTLHPEKNAFLKLKNFLDANEEIAVCSPQMLDEHGNFRMTIDHFSSLQREILRRPILEFLFPKNYLNRKKFYHQPTRVDYVQGSYMFVRAADFNAIGGFDTNLFLYYEESDLCRRLLKDKGKLTYLFPELTYKHYKGASTQKNVIMKTELKLSLLYTIRKHYGYWAYKTLLTHFQVRYFFSSLLKPRYFYLWKTLMRGAHISESLKQKQPVRE